MNNDGSFIAQPETNIQQTTSDYTPEPTPRKKINKALVVSIICGLAGLLIGGLVTFFTFRPTPTNEHCECNCDSKSTDFDFKFLSMENIGKNAMYSPLSIKYALNLLREGASGNTKSQIDAVLSNDELTKYTNIENKLSLANSVWIRDSFEPFVNPSYIQSVKDKFDAEIKFDPFAGVDNINNWVADKTFNLIQNPLNPSSITSLTEMVLINALAIQMDWVSQFDDSNTYGEDFYLKDGNTMRATTMSKETYGSDALYYIDNNITAATLDLEKIGDTQLEFMAIMPKNEDLESYAKHITQNDIDSISRSLKKADSTEDGIDLRIPKFKFESGLPDFVADLKRLGITDAFDEELADFSNMANKQLYVSDAVHKSLIDFSEDGIKAAVVTSFSMNTTVAFKEPIIVKFDHPFLFIIRDKNSSENWFVGAVYEPNSWDNDKAEYKW